MDDGLMPQLVAICGKKRAGKDTLGEFLVTQYGYKRIAFADKVKEGVVTINPVLYSLPGDVQIHLQDLQMRGETAIELCDRLKDEIPEVRRLLKAFAHETMQVLFRLESFWVQQALKDIGEDDDQRYVITDMRYPHEAEAVREKGGVIFRVTRPGHDNDDQHASEQSVALVDADIDYINDATLGDYYSSAVCLLSAWEAG